MFINLESKLCHRKFINNNLSSITKAKENTKYEKSNEGTYPYRQVHHIYEDISLFHKVNKVNSNYYSLKHTCHSLQLNTKQKQVFLIQN